MSKKLSAFYVGDSRAYRIYQIRTEGYVGSVYASKELKTVPVKVNVDLVGPVSPGWRKEAEAIHADMKPGSKAEVRLSKLLE